MSGRDKKKTWLHFPGSSKKHVSPTVFERLGYATSLKAATTSVTVYAHKRVGHLSIRRYALDFVG